MPRFSTLGLAAALFVLAAPSVLAQPITTLQISEIRRDQESASGDLNADPDEYFELIGPDSLSLDDHTFIVIGDGAGGVGVIEAVVPLDGEIIPADSVFLAADDDDTFGAEADLVTNLNFENGDTVTYLLVTGFTGVPGQDLDTDDDGTLDATPWTSVVDAVSSVDDTEGTAYAASLAFEDVGPNGEFPPAHLYRDGVTGDWTIGPFSGVRYDTPGERNASTAMVQVIHNSPDLALDSVNVYINGGLAVDTLVFQSATPYVTIPAGLATEIDVTLLGSEDPVYTLELDEGVAFGSVSQLVAIGLATDDIDDDNDAEFELLVIDDARMAAEMATMVDLRIVHGSPDAPAVDVTANGTALTDSLAYPEFTDYISITPDSYEIEVTADTSGADLGRFVADLSGAAGEAVTVLATGFFDAAVDDPNTEEDETEEILGLLAVFADGTTAVLPYPVSIEPGSEVELALAVANPIRSEATVRFALGAPGRARVALYDALGRRVATLADGEVGLGEQTARLDAAALASGVYVLRLEAEGGAIARTITVVR